MAEFADGAGILVDPLDADALAAALAEAIGVRHDELAAAAIERASHYSWDNAAALTVDAYREAVAS
jgi:glycosyltransferase involved in cell wall biosynthesis